MHGSRHLEYLQGMVFDEVSFIEFLEALSFDKQVEDTNELFEPADIHHSTGWEHEDIASYLSASAAWAKSSIGDSSLTLKESNPWKRVAEILLVGKDSC